MKVCPACNEKENDDDERFCITCGLDLDKSQNKNLQINSNVQTKNINLNNKILGKLIFSDDQILTIDDSQRLIGRADLKIHTKKDQNIISRSHFTIYKKDQKYFIKDGITNVQNRSSESGTILNEEKLSDDDYELKNGDKILVSDVLMLFEV